MTMVRPVLRKDPFAGVAWSTSLTLLALKKLSLRERPKGEELQSIADTVAFVGSLLMRHLNVFSEVGRRAHLFWSNVQTQLITRDEITQLENDLREVLLALDCGVSFDDVWTSLLKRSQETVLGLLLALNHCRRG